MNIPMIDTLIATIDINDYNEATTQLSEKLEQKKNEAKQALTDNVSKIISIKIGDLTFKVLPNGKKGYAYILHNDLYEINLSQYRSKNNDFYPVYIKIKSECLWNIGPVKAWEDIYNWVEKNIGEISNNKISRIDLCCHTDEISLDEDDIKNFKGVYCAETLYRFRRKLTGMNFGSSATEKVYCRIYDKIKEIQQKKHKNWFFEIWKKNGLGQNTVWNVEFQLCRELLKENCIETVSQAFDSLGSLWDYCTKKWIVKIIHDNKNITRCSTDAVWTKIQEAFKNFESQPLVKREVQLRTSAEAMIPSTFGNISTFCALTGVSDEKLAFSILSMYIKRYLAPKKQTFGEAVRKKAELITKKLEKSWIAKTIHMTKEEAENYWQNLGKPNGIDLFKNMAWN